MAEDARLVGDVKVSPARTRLRVIVCLIVAVVVIVLVIFAIVNSRKTPGPAPAPPPFPYSADPDQRAIEIFQNYLKINTGPPNPAFNDAIALLGGLADMFGFEKLQVDYVAAGVTKSGLLVSWKAETTHPSIFLLSHMDVVGVEDEKWTRDPFGGELDPATGNIYGRGSQDSKNLGVFCLESLYRLKQSGFKLNRSVHIFYETGEETRESTSCEPQFWDAIWPTLNVGLVLDEGMASGPDNDNLVVLYGQRLSWPLEIRAEGPAGHGSLILNNTAIMKLTAFLSGILEIRAEQEALWLSGKSRGTVTTINPTVLAAGFQRNVVPSLATAKIDIRIAPGAVENMTQRILDIAATTEVAALQANNASEPAMSPHGPGDFWWNAILQALNTHLANTTGAVVMPDVLPAGASGQCLRERFGVPVYNFSPMPRTPILAHDHDEFFNNATLVEGVATYEALLRTLASI